MKQIALATSSIIIGLLFILGSGSNSDTGETAKTAPTANAGANQNMLLGTTLTLTGSGTDSDGTIVKYEWKEGDTVIGSTITLEYSAETVGVHTLTLTVTDNDQLTANDTVLITVTETQTQLAPLKVYVAGESIEHFNHINTLPFKADGTLNGTENSVDEFGWMVPFAERLKLRESALEIEWVGTDCWTNPDNSDCSTGTYTNRAIGHTSAQAGSTIEDWQNLYGEELTNKTYCYNVAFASRGGNDLNGDVPASTYEAQLKQLVLDLDEGSNCHTHPIVYITAHMLDSAAMNGTPITQADADNWLAQQKAYYVDIAKRVTTELNSEGYNNVAFIDMWTPFYENTSTTAFPNPNWWITDSGVHRPDLVKIHREENIESAQHPKRLASIFAGEQVADQIDITQLKTHLTIETAE